MLGRADLRLTFARPQGIFGIPTQGIMSLQSARAFPNQACATGAAAEMRAPFGMTMTIITITTRSRAASG
jgi:hypothetical protein